MCKEISSKLVAKNFFIEEQKDFELTVDPNFIIKKNDSIWILPFYQHHPYFHELGDRVVNVRGNSKLKYSIC